MTDADVLERRLAPRPALHRRWQRFSATVLLNLVGGLPVIPLFMYTGPWLHGQFGDPLPDYGDPEFASTAKVTTVLLGFLLLTFLFANNELQRIVTGRRWGWWALASASVLTPLVAFLVHHELTSTVSG